jgi:hypothetical protein
MSSPADLVVQGVEAVAGFIVLPWRIWAALLARVLR